MVGRGIWCCSEKSPQSFSSPSSLSLLPPFPPPPPSSSFFFFLTLIALSPEVEVLDNKNQKDL